jgi:hypothetical protein
LQQFMKSSPWMRAGFPAFSFCKASKKQPTAPTLYYVFDVVWHNGEDPTGKPFLERRAVFEQILKPEAGIEVDDYVENEGTALFNLTKEKGMEGIIAKSSRSQYQQQTVDSSWPTAQNPAGFDFSCIFDGAWLRIRKGILA